MSELLNEYQLKIKERKNGHNRIDRFEPESGDFTRIVDKKIKPTKIPKEVILRLIRYFEES